MTWLAIIGASLSRRQKGLELRLKRMVDLAGVVLLAGPVLFILLILGLLIRLDSPGPAIFLQRRIGLDRRPFTCYKLRTMRVDAPQAPHRAFIAELMAEDGEDLGIPRVAIERGDDGLYKLTDDPRVTRLGGFLRASSLDELPQLFNVLRGEMSLVGPRPVVAYELEHYRPRDMRRFDVLPGITGLWQVSGRSSRSYREMLDLDVEYAMNWSLGLDFEVFFRTFGTLLRGSRDAR